MSSRTIKIWSLTLGILMVGLPNTIDAQSAHRYLRDGNYAYQDGNYSAAEEAYRRSLELEEQAQTVFNLGNSLFQQERYEEAVSKFQQVVEAAGVQQGLKANAYHNLGNTFFEMQDYKNSVEAYKNAMRLRPDDASTRYNLAQAQHLFLENAAFDLALKLKPGYSPKEEGPKVGDIHTYNITVVNEGDVMAQDVGVVDYLPEGMKVIDPNWQVFNGAIAEYRPGIARIEAGDSVTIAVQLEVIDASKEEGLFNAVEISKAANRYGKQDVDSTPANAAESPQEDDFAAEQQSDQQQQQQQQSDQQNQSEQQQNQEQSSDQQDKQQSQQESQQQQQDQSEQPPNEQQQQQGGEKQNLSPEEARRLLRIIEEEELQVMEKLKKSKGNSTKREKDW